MTTLRIATIVAALVCVSVTTPSRCAETTRIPLRLLYLSRTKAPARTDAFADFLKRHFISCRIEKREDFQPAFTNDVDVVVLDWSQDERVSNEVISPIGPLENWKH